MQVTETQSEGFKRELKVVIKAKEIEDKVAARLEQLKGQINLKGFRPGKVPVAHIRKLYGKSVAAEIVQQTVAESSQKALTERELKPAHEPEVGLTEDKEEIDRIISGQADLAYTLSFEVLPEFDVANLSTIELDRYIAEVTGEAIDRGVERLLENGISYQPKDGPAETGDRVTIDFVGTIGGEEFEGGSSEDAPVVLGQNAFIPGFEEGLVGAVKDEDRTIKTNFPEDYPVEKLAGKAAEFAVKIKEVALPVKPELDEQFAKNMGLDNVDALRDAIQERIKQEYDGVTKNRLKRQLLDRLDDVHKFDLPPKLLEMEFDAIWKRVTGELERAGKSFEDEGTTEEEARETYQKVCERRVRLGLVLSQIGDANNIEVSEEDIRRALFQRAQEFPGQEKQVIEFYQKNPQAMAELRAPIFEERVVDFIIELAQVTEKVVSPEELFEAPDGDNEEDEMGSGEVAASEVAEDNRKSDD